MIGENDLTLAVKNSIEGEMGITEEDARRLAQHVLNFFGYSDRIIDNVLEPEDRDAFYMMEDSGILYTEREEITLYDGREWRIHYWLFNRDRIMKLRDLEPEQRAVPDASQSVYADIPDDVWNRSSAQ
ncbi:hypothetical protein O8W32_05815 [Methanomassiliicoccales archaeon LGM-DZ1]|nr:hypothetical protein O8W32_05815 [Methanomassiliicoccales archaeon LGM-DZ1]